MLHSRMRMLQHETTWIEELENQEKLEPYDQLWIEQDRWTPISIAESKTVVT